MNGTLSVTDGPHVGRAYAFLEHDTFIVGRSPEAHFRLPMKDKAISRSPFLVEVNPPSCRLMDMASTNGTFVNRRKVASTDLEDGDVITGGRTTFVVAIDESVAPPSPRASPSPSTGPSTATRPPGSPTPGP